MTTSTINDPCERPDCRHHRQLLAQSCPLTDLDEATKIIINLVNQACSFPGGLDSMGISDYAEAIDYLAKRGFVEIDHQAGRYVTARWIKTTVNGNVHPDDEDNT
jgi:hypothetical protein